VTWSAQWRRLDAVRRSDEQPPIGAGKRLGPRHKTVEARVVPLDGRPHLPATVTSYMGDSRGHWEGNTLVVVTKNLNGMTGVGGNGGGRTSGRLTITERFSMLDANTLQYTATIDDPGTWTRPWTLSLPWKREPVYGMFEYACHEGNYAMRNMLSASRAAEASASK